MPSSLGQALRPHDTRLMLQRCLLRPGRTITIPPATADSNEVASTDELPYLAKFLLLAAYLCQTNKADLDKNLYINARSGRRRKTRGDNSHSESLTHQRLTHRLKRRYNNYGRTELCRFFSNEFSLCLAPFATNMQTMKLKINRNTISYMMLHVVQMHRSIVFSWDHYL